MRKVTWRKIHTDFKRLHPNLGKLSACYQPYDYAEIFIYLDNGMKLVYNYDTKRVRFNAEPRRLSRPAQIRQAVL